MLTIRQLVEQNPNLMMNRDFMIDLVTDTKHHDDPATLEGAMLYKGKLIKQGNKIFTIIDTETRTLDEVKVPNKRPYMDKATEITATPTALSCVEKDTKTVLGNFIMNVFVNDAFEGAVPYWNKRWDYGAIEEQVVAAFHEKKISVQQIYRFQDNMNFLPSYSDFFTYSITKKAITVDPKVKKERDRLRKENKGKKLTPEEALAQEDYLISLDRKSHEGDDAQEFLVSGKNYDVQRKRMFLGMGLVEPFGDPGGDFENLSTVLDEGWDVEDVPAINNDIRRGFYSRGKNTAIGGTIMKILARIFQELRIVEKDCNTTGTIDLEITADIAKSLYSRVVIEGSKKVELTKDNIGKYIGKKVKLRSPMYCRSKGGVCATCVDQNFDKLDIQNLNLQPFIIGSVVQGLSMKSMHGTKLSTFHIENLDEFCV